MITSRADYEKGYNQALDDVIAILNKHDANPKDCTKFSIRCFQEVKTLKPKVND